MKEIETYDTLECPLCNKLCKPDAIGQDGTVIYERHKCKTSYQLEARVRRFEIDINGDIVE